MSRARSLSIASVNAMIYAALKSLMMHKLRSMLTVLGLVFGVASVIVMMAVAEGASEEAQRQIESLGVNNIIVRSVKPLELDGENPMAGFEYGVTFEDMDRISETIHTVVNTTPQREFVHEVRFRDQTSESRVVGVHPNYATSNRLELAIGRFIQQTDMKYASNICVIGEDLAKKLYRNKSPIGRSILVSDRHFFRIVGITKWKTPSAGVGSSLSAQDFNSDVYIPLTADLGRIGAILMRQKVNSYKAEKLELSQITVEVEGIDSVQKTAAAIEGLLAMRHTVKDFAITVPLDLLEQARNTQRIFNFVLGATAAISLLVGGIGIMNIMLANVSERTREIGVRRALGAKQSDIVTQFLIETTVLSCIGIVIGMIVGVAAPLMVELATGMNTKTTVSSVIVAIAVALGVGVTFGIYPARQAAKLDPIEALRHS